MLYGFSASNCAKLYFNLFLKGIWLPKCRRSSICSLSGLSSARAIIKQPLLTIMNNTNSKYDCLLPFFFFSYISVCIFFNISSIIVKLIQQSLKRSICCSRDETSQTATPGPNSPNDYLQYGVSHADDIYYLFKVTKKNKWSKGRGKYVRLS